jgi:hypothetical protein
MLHSGYVTQSEAQAGDRRIGVMLDFYLRLLAQPYTAQTPPELTASAATVADSGQEVEPSSFFDR